SKLNKLYRCNIYITNGSILELCKKGILEGDVHIDKGSCLVVNGILNGTIYNEGTVILHGFFLGSIYGQGITERIRAEEC
ncbi:hypothetical protein, partial [Acinetobacter stercoris]|uniref:hypothetical protein n=1 Tax=Acinetobacter stercoris TaxID=2126983 RepID=UPI001BC8908C